MGVRASTAAQTSAEPPCWAHLKLYIRPHGPRQTSAGHEGEHPHSELNLGRHWFVGEVEFTFEHRELAKQDADIGLLGLRDQRRQPRRIREAFPGEPFEPFDVRHVRGRGVELLVQLGGTPAILLVMWV